MSSYSTLFRRFILRALAREKLRSGITALGISLGVAVVIAIRLANASSLESFRAATESMAGETSIQITGTAGRFDEMILARLGWLRDYGRVSPVIAGLAMTDPETRAGTKPKTGMDAATSFAPKGEFIQVMGVDAVRDRPLRHFKLVRFRDDESQPTPRELLLLLTDPGSILLTDRFARARGLTLGSRLPLLIGDRRREFVVRGLLLDEGPARALQGNFALMDIAAAQLAFNRLGTVDRVDVKLKRGLELEAAESEIRRNLPSTLVVTRPESGYREVEKMIAAFHFNLSALGSIALLVGLFLIYNTVSISVITRREEVGALRAVGASRKLVLALFLGEAVLLSIIEGRQAVRVSGLHLGYSGLTHARASGKVLLAYGPPGTIEAYLQSHAMETPTRRTVNDGGALQAEAARTRAAGYAVDEEEFAEGVSCVAAPVADGSMAIGISAPSERFRERRAELIDTVVEIASMTMIPSLRSATA